MAIPRNGATAVSGGDDGTVRVWDLTTGTQRAKLTDHDGQVWRRWRSTADGATAVSGSDDRTVRVWDLATESEAAHRTGDYRRGRLHGALSGQPLKIAVGSNDTASPTYLSSEARRPPLDQDGARQTSQWPGSNLQ